MSALVPLLFCDVDGVVRPDPYIRHSAAGKPDPSVWNDWTLTSALHDGDIIASWYSPTVTALLSNLHDTGAVDMRWLTSWGHHANTNLYSAIGMPKLDVVATKPGDNPLPCFSCNPKHGIVNCSFHSPDSGRWWKWDAVKKIVAANPKRPIIWLDDDLAHGDDNSGRGAVAWAAKNANCLLVAPKRHLGLTSRHLRLIKDFVANNN